MPCSSTSQLTTAPTQTLPLTQPQTPAQWAIFVQRLQSIINAARDADNRTSVNVVPAAYAIYDAQTAPSLTVSGATLALDSTKAQFGISSLKLTATASVVTLQFTAYPISIQPDQRWIESVYIQSSRVAIVGTMAVQTAVQTYPVDISGTLIPSTWGRLYGDCDLTADGSTAATIVLTLTGCSVGDTFNLEGWQLEASSGSTNLPSPFVNTATPGNLDGIPDSLTRYGAVYNALIQAGIYKPGDNMIPNPNGRLGVLHWPIAFGGNALNGENATSGTWAWKGFAGLSDQGLASDHILIPAGTNLVLSVEMDTHGITGGAVKFGVTFINSSGSGISSSEIVATNGSAFFNKYTLAV